MSGALQALIGRRRTRIAVTIGGTDPWGFSNGAFGSISPTTYIDKGGNTRTPVILEYASTGTQIILRLSGVITNDDTVFSALYVGGTRLARSAGTYSTDSSTYSQWNWNTGSNILGTSGTVQVPIV